MPPPYLPYRRPPWWPEDETWPPRRPDGWGHGPPPVARRFFRRIGALLLLLFILTVGGCTLAFWFGAGLAGLIQLPHGSLALVRALVPLGMVVGIFGVLLTARALRGAAAPVGDFMDAVGRVSDGDYSARVPEDGPREARAMARAFNRMAEHLEASEARRRGLLADVTHELRTPLTVMQGNLEGVLDGVYPADAQHLGPILDEMQVLSRLIDDLRTLALAESGSLALHREPTDLGVLAGETVAAFRSQAEAAGIRLELSVADDLPLLAVDPVRLREVLGNLVANALRYTPSGGQIRVAGTRTGEGGATLSVVDNGRGIAPDALPHIFDRFYKGPDSRGTGLGLAIARNLARAHGGELSVQSAPGQGTAMTLSLPGEGG